MPRAKTPKQIQSEIEELNERISFLQKRCEGLEETLQIRQETISNLNREINRLNEQFEGDRDISKQTVTSCTDRLTEVFSNIQCPITQREAFKQFVKGVIESCDHQIDEFQSAMKQGASALGRVREETEMLKVSIGNAISRI